MANPFKPLITNNVGVHSKNEDKTLTTLFGMFLFTTLIAQDGSDIKYVDINEIDESCIHKIVQLDFYHDSSNRFNFNNEDRNDSIDIQLENKIIRFKEHRVDDGYNNWFSQQYLESIDYIEGAKIKIPMCLIEDVTADHIKVKLFWNTEMKTEK